MIIGVLGKGGTGKSTISTILIKSLAKQGVVLGIDADHNMDLTYNFGNPEINYIAGSFIEAKKHIGIEPEIPFKEVFKGNTSQTFFSLSPLDKYTKKYIKEISSNIFLMSSGPQTDAVLYDESCSHSLFSSLKVYLPLLKLGMNESVVVDEKAGADGVTTGIVTGFNVALIVVEATEHSVKVAEQIAGYLKFFKTPYEFVVNKYQKNSIKNNIFDTLSKSPLVYFEFNSNPLEENEFSEDILNQLKEKYIEDTRYIRTKEKLENNTLFKNKK
jgi:CO dehydrogenase maturation factor